MPGPGHDLARTVEHEGGTVEHELVLTTHLIDVHERHATGLGHPGTQLFDSTIELAAVVRRGVDVDDDLGPGGWTQINAAHTSLINAELEKISGQGLTAVITFGAAHKYKILESLEGRSDIELSDAGALSDEEEIQRIHDELIELERTADAL